MTWSLVKVTTPDSPLTEVTPDPIALPLQIPSASFAKKLFVAELDILTLVSWFKDKETTSPPDPMGFGIYLL